MRFVFGLLLAVAVIIASCRVVMMPDIHGHGKGTESDIAKASKAYPAYMRKCLADGEFPQVCARKVLQPNPEELLEQNQR